MLNKKIFLISVIFLAGCTHATKKIYYWDKYPSTVYQYYHDKKSTPDDQIATLLVSMEKSQAKGQKTPPGLHAHLGLLYANIGHADLAFEEFNNEKRLFPESAAFMDFLMKKDKGSLK
ncbi:hypothetical protein EDC52_10661 [Biostraticola tofi]|uniref:DUF4810 domain-containing protein n=2 Tax=Biostraticola tofi TaxID=466109 RepID=A0A4R3YRR2_9GAMM|nr:hypothetical protein EDC52_10661 [Biostraticola tofi]